MKRIAETSRKEMMKELESNPPIGVWEQILKEAYKRNEYPVIEYIAKEGALEDNNGLAPIILDYIMLKHNGVGKNLLYTLLNESELLASNLPQVKLRQTCIESGDTLKATALLSAYTPAPITHEIVANDNLSDPTQATFLSADENMAKQLTTQNNVLVEMIQLLRKGFSWDNKTSASLMVYNRLKTSLTSDTFMAEAAKGNLSESVASMFLTSVYSHDNITSINKKFVKNILYNENEDVIFAVTLKRFRDTQPNKVLGAILRYADGNDENPKRLERVWEYIMQSAGVHPFDFGNLFNNQSSEYDNPMLILAKKSPRIASDVISLLKICVEGSKGSYNVSHVEEIIDFGLNNPAFRESILEMPKAFFDNIGMSPQNRQLVEDKYDIEPRELDEHEEIMENIFSSKKSNWYQKYSQVNDTITQEAGWKENIGITLLSSLVLILSGSTIKSAAERMKLKEEDVISAMNDPSLMDQAKQMARTENPQMTEPFSRSMPYNEEETQANSEQEAIMENILTRTIYAETKNEPLEGKKAVASVIYKRGGQTPEGMVQAIKIPYQFSCWNSAGEKDWVNMKQGSGKDWEESKQIAKSLMNGTFNPIENWDHYWNPEKANPSWAYEDPKTKTKFKPYIQIGSHRFLNLKQFKTKA